jgi:hypothetical protein
MVIRVDHGKDAKDRYVMLFAAAAHHPAHLLAPPPQSILSCRRPIAAC